MTRKNKILPVIEAVEITDLAAEGKAMAKVNGMVVFVPWAAPGDVVDIRLYRKRRNYAEGSILRVHKYSDERVKPFCEHFTVCGGCKWQHIPYENQLKFKQKQVTDDLQHIGKVHVEEFLPIVGSEKTVGYRNKLEFTFSNKRWLTSGELEKKNENTEMNGAGFHVSGMFDKVLDIGKCWLQEDIANHIRLFVKAYCLKNSCSFFDLKAQTGFMRTLIIRTSSKGEVMVIAVFHEDDIPKRESLLRALADHFPEITSLMYVVNGKCNDTITDLEVVSYSGKDHLTEEMEGLKFKVGPKSFYQTNSRQAYRLYSIARDFAQLSGDDTVYDLYTGTGTIANFIARRAKRIIGIEYVAEAIRDAQANARLNGINNAEFFAGDMKDILTREFIAAHRKPDVIIADPPRAGMHDAVTETILSVEPKRIVYVSCNPATQARDLNRLGLKYGVSKVQPADMFPHTHHVENVALLELKKV
ncbi:MAG: 23S rRNA (uracil(1939)-C(5))-methyltransferase RlmD [Tannerella sp.]|jgi:23S rRNA (uracil1939-C5)-methyltransferase|nr:23S rRNA (uracil(1939)-C(5))-methyltransferase RlmD [Tannerella sp.]